MSEKRKIWVISDTHFGHENIIHYCNRPFRSSKEMDDAMQANWNRVVSPQDIVYHLGDVYFTGGKDPDYFWKLVKSLKGRKRLVLGNHDELPNKLLQEHFQKITVWRHFGKDYGCILTHVPMQMDAREDDPYQAPFNVHGHIHEKKPSTKRHICVSVEHIDYTPVNLEVLMATHNKQTATTTDLP